MKARLSFIFSLVCLWVAAQDIPEDSVSIPSTVPVSDTISYKRGFSIRPVLLIDYGKLISTAAGYDTRYEGSFQLLINNKYELVGEYGTADLSPENAYSNGNYNSNGSYYRFGAGVYSQLNPKSKLGIGLSTRRPALKTKDLLKLNHNRDCRTGIPDPMGYRS